jgi:hypothetical protein
MILGSLSILATYPYCGIPFNILGLIFSLVALTQIKANPRKLVRHGRCETHLLHPQRAADWHFGFIGRCHWDRKSVDFARLI